MSTGALIAAAGMSVRMMQFKQLMKIGNRTMAERVIVNFRQAGVSEIVMVTGHRSEQLEKELRGFGVTFLKNADYETTEMFASVKIGLDFLKDRCARVFFCPVDVPFFMEKTVRTLMEQDGDVIQPVYEGKAGHPILMRTSLIPEIISYQGDSGLKGALRAIPDLERVRVPVDDEAVVMDADTREDFQRLADLHNARLMHPQVTLRLANHKTFFERETATLLRRIEETGSVREACEHVGISYSKGWNIIHDAEDGVGCRIVERQPGGKNGGTAGVTMRGKKLIELYTQYENRMEEAAREIFSDIFLESELF